MQKHVFHNLNFRHMDRAIKKNLKGPLVGVEIGVWGAGHACDLLHNLNNIKTLYLVDPYTDYEEYPELKGLGDKTFQDANNRLKKFSDKAVFIRKMSEDCVDNFEDNSLDFCYIDGNHAYDYIKKDIELYYPKVKPGGILGGHDFSTCHPGVPKAVIEFCEETGRKLHGGKIDWWVIKNKSI